MALSVITPPAVEPISASEAKASPSLRVTTTADDTDITALIKTARLMAETRSLHALVTQTLELVLDGFPTGGIKLPMPPLQSVTSIKYIDTDDTEQTLSSALYDVDTETVPGMVAPAADESWPTDVMDQINAVRVRYVAGFGGAAEVPADIKSWIKITVGTLYDNPQGFVVGTAQTVTPIPRNYVDALLDNYRYMAIQF